MLKQKINNLFDRIISIEGAGYLLLIISIFIGITGFRHNYFHLSYGKLMDQLLNDFYANITVDFFSVSIAILVLDRLSKKRSDREEQQNLIQEMTTSSINSIAIEAVRKYREKEYPLILEGTTIKFANLENAELYYFNFKRGNFSYSNLNHANLNGVNFEDAIIADTNFHGAIFHKAKFINARIYSEKPDSFLFEDSDLHLANFSGAKFIYNSGSDIVDGTDIQLIRASRLEGAIMPNGKMYDGRYCLSGDLQTARGKEIDTNNHRAMAQFFGVSIEEYNDGQKWYEVFPHKKNWYFI